MRKQGSVFFRSKSGNCYLYNPEVAQILLLHPLLFYLAKIEHEEGNIKKWVRNLEEKGIHVKDCGTFSKDEIRYYWDKYLFLKKNGYFDEVDFKKVTCGRLNAEQVKLSLAKTENVSFEVTDACNMKCSYCIYSGLYTHYDKRENKYLSVDVAKNFLNYLAELYESIMHIPCKRRIRIGFYGGEALLNFKFIEDIVYFSREYQKKYNYDISFGMTTNGLLLAKHIDFLAENNFNLLISLDGNERNNGYRLLLNGEPSYKKVFENILLIKNSYPDYFLKKVKFNAVLHNKNSIPEIFHYFKENFQKTPMFSEVGNFWISNNRKNYFSKIYKSAFENLTDIEDYNNLEEDVFLRLPNIRNLIRFVNRFSNSIFSTYNDFFFSRRHKNVIPTGTCNPFEKKTYISVNGKVLPCEQIGHNFVLAYADEKSVKIDFEQIANKYNRLYDRAYQCNSCYVGDKCNKCIFFLIKDDETIDCEEFMNKNKFSKYLSTGISSLEKKPALYTKIVNEVDYV